MRRIVTIAGTPFTVQDRGEGPPLLLLHGATQDHTIWSRQVRRFRRSHRTVAPDMRGHGATPLGPAIEAGEAVLSLDTLAEDALALMDALAIERAVVCGVSLGGMTALALAERAPERVEALVLANTPLALSLNRTLLRAIDWLNPYAVLVPLLRWTDPRGLARLGVRLLRLLLGRGWARPEAARRLIRAFGRMSPCALVEVYRTICEARLPDLTRVRCPVLVVTGVDETGMIFRHAAEIARRIGRAELVTLPGGHVTNIDAPDAFNDALDAFLARWLEPARGGAQASEAGPGAVPEVGSGAARRSASASAGSMRPS